MKLAHCSDLHLLSLEGARFLDFANKRWIGGLNLIANRGRHYHAEIFEAMVEDINGSDVDEVLVTGDITNLALEDEFRFARTLFDRFELGPEHVTVLPGNHDAYVQKGAEYFARHFEPYFRSDEGFGDDPWPVARLRSSVALVGLSTSLQTPWFTAYGVIGEGQASRLRDILTNPAVSDCFRLVAIHHPPAGPPAKSRVRGLRDRQRLETIVAEVGVDMVLHGHAHLDLFHELTSPKGAIPVRGIQSGTYEAGSLKRRARYRVYDFDGAALVGESVRVWDPESRAFVAEEPATTRAAG